MSAPTTSRNPYVAALILAVPFAVLALTIPLEALFLFGVTLVAYVLVTGSKQR